MLSSLPQSPREHQRWENILRSLSRHKGGQVFARIDWGVSRALGYLAHVTLSPQRWAFLPSCGSHYHGGTHSWSTYCLLRGRLPPAGPGAVPWRRRQPGNVGGGPPGRWLLDRGFSVELPGSFPRPRPMTGCLRMLPIIRLTEHKGATRGLSRPGARDGCTGALGLHHREQGCAHSLEDGFHTQE